jgi:hypothetical protein
VDANEVLAARLRQAVQGCSYHIQGPVQAWAAIEAATAEGEADPREVARVATASCARRVAELRAAGARDDDPAVRKEQLTLRFIEKLLG